MTLRQPTPEQLTSPLRFVAPLLAASSVHRVGGLVVDKPEAFGARLRSLGVPVASS
jgi:hypothetical protein